MIFWNVEPSLVSGAELEYPATLVPDTKSSDTVLIISNLPEKTFSLIVKIHKQSISNSLKFPVIKLDKDNVGPLVKGDKVMLTKFNPPLAKQVLVLIDTKYPLVEGNYGSKIINQAINGEIVDIGQQINFMYGQEKPIFISGFIKATIPKAPSLVGSETIFIVEKIVQEQLMKLKIAAEISNEKRAKDYLQSIKDEKFSALSSIRNNSYSKLERTFYFSQVNPQTLYKVLIKLLESSFHSFIVNNSDTVDESFLASLLAFPKTDKGSDPKYLVECILTAKNNEGACFIIGYSNNNSSAEQIVISLEKQLKTVSNTLQEVPRVVSDLCGGCNAKLNLLKQNEKGIVYCSSCKSPNILPYALRL